MELGAEAAATGFRLSVFASIASTNDAALAGATEGDLGNHWFVAHKQSAGRGRSGRRWASEPGNLFATLLLVDPCPTVDLPKLGFVAGIALHEAVLDKSSWRDDIRLKWPNDLLAGGAKLAGILLEGRALPDGRQAVAVGIGVNCTNHPEDLPYAATNLANMGMETTAAKLFSRLSSRMAENLRLFDRAAGFDLIRQAWLSVAYGLNGPIVVRTGKDQRQGTFAGLDVDGRLLLDTPQKRHIVDAADIFFPSPAAQSALE